MLTVQQTIKSYNGRTVVNIPDLSVHQGEIVGLVGNNGAGKTTFFRLLLDLVRADRGEIRSGEHNVSTSEGWKCYTAAYLDEGFLINYLTPEEYFYFVGSLHGRSRVDVDEFLLGFAGFFDDNILKSGKYIRDLSKGNQFKVGIAACLIQHPEVLILDEPFANLDPSSQLRLIKILKELSLNRRVTILISSHDLTHITDVCRRVLLMERGRIVKDIDTTDETLKELEHYFDV